MAATFIHSSRFAYRHLSGQPWDTYTSLRTLHTSTYKGRLSHKVTRASSPRLHVSSVDVNLAQSLLRPILASMQRQPHIYISVLQTCNSANR